MRKYKYHELFCHFSAINFSLSYLDASPSQDVSSKPRDDLDHRGVWRAAEVAIRESFALTLQGQDPAGHLARCVEGAQPPVWRLRA